MSIPESWFEGIRNTGTPLKDTGVKECEYLSREVKEQREWTIVHDAGFLRQAASAAYEDNWANVGLASNATKGTLGTTNRSDLPGVMRHSWVYQSNWSDMRRAVWYNATINCVLISYRGTNAGGQGGTGDVLADLAIGKGVANTTPMYREDAKHFDRIKKAFKGATIEVTGHSLGGHRASAIGRSKHVRSSGFNEGSKPPIPLNAIELLTMMFGKKEKGDPLHTCYRVAGDVVSMGAKVTKSCETADMPEGGSGALYAHTGAMSEAFGLPDALRICSRGTGDQKCI